jgi:hypothetical protein
VTGLGERLEDDWDAAVTKVREWTHRTSESSEQSQQEEPVSVLGTIHKDLSAAGGAIQHAWPLFMQLSTNPLLDELVEAGLTAAGAGVEAAAFAAATDALRGAAARKQGTVQQAEAAVTAAEQAAQQAAPAKVM